MKTNSDKLRSLLVAIFVAVPFGALAIDEYVPSGSNSFAEQQQAAVRDTENIEAYEAFLKGWQHYRRFTPEDFANAMVHLKRAVELDPEYGRAHGALALMYQWARYLSYSSWDMLDALGLSESSARAEARKSLTLGQKYGPTSLSYQAASYHTSYLTNAQRAVTLDPNDPEGFIALAHAYIHLGRPVESSEAVETAMRLDPHYPSRYLFWLGMAKFHSEDFEEAVALLEKEAGRSVYRSWTFPLLVAAYGHLGRDKDARIAIEKWKKQQEKIDGGPMSLTQLKFSAWRNMQHYHAPGDSDRFRAGLLKAGLPD